MNLLLDLANGVLDIMLDVLLELGEFVILVLVLPLGHEDQSGEDVFLAIEAHVLLDNEVELLLDLVQKAGAEVVNPLIGHTHFGDQEVQKHDLHDEDVGNNEEPAESNDGILVVAHITLDRLVWIQIIWKPARVLVRSEISDRVSECLECHDDEGVRSEVIVVGALTVVTFDDDCHEHEDP